MGDAVEMKMGMAGGNEGAGWDNEDGDGQGNEIGDVRPVVSTRHGFLRDRRGS